MTRPRSILLIVGGGIAAFKALELLRLLRKAVNLLLGLDFLIFLIHNFGGVEDGLSVR